jgi:hypothetical protein
MHERVIKIGVGEGRCGNAMCDIATHLPTKTHAARTKIPWLCDCYDRVYLEKCKCTIKRGIKPLLPYAPQNAVLCVSLLRWKLSRWLRSSFVKSL